MLSKLDENTYKEASTLLANLVYVFEVSSFHDISEIICKMKSYMNSSNLEKQI